MTVSTAHYWIALNRISGLGPAGVARMHRSFGSVESIFSQPHGRLCEAGCDPESAARIRNASLLGWAKEECERTRHAGVSICTLDDDSYPPLLREIHAPPPVLYLKGNRTDFSLPAFAIVGMRRPSPYGRKAAAMLAGELAEAGVVVVSGLALGIDTVAHRACMARGGTTFAVLGCGIDRIYGTHGATLAREIETHGALVSEFPMGTPPAPYHFPRRNRIISGCASGVIVVEAGKRSGSLITAHYALAQNREVCAVPGSIFSRESCGTFNIIKNGAIPISSTTEIIELIQRPRLGLNPQPMSAPARTTPTAFPEELLSEPERLVIQSLTEDPARIDQITDRCSLPVTELFDCLLRLELKGAVRQLPGQQYVRA